MMNEECGMITAEPETRSGARLALRGSAKHYAQPLLTVIVPVFNEARTVDELLRRVVDATLTPTLSQREREEKPDIQVIVVDDGSTDATRERLETWRTLVTVLSHAENRGKGSAIRTGLTPARGQFIIIQDADLEYDPRDYERLLEPLLIGKADAAYGVRRLRWSICHLGVSVLNQIVRWIYGIRISDEATCYKVFRTNDLRAMDLQCEGFEFCPEVTAKACRMGLSICEVPISYNPRSVVQGKKLRWRDGWAAIKTLWRWRDWQRVKRV